MRKNAFTMIEILVVVTIIGILFGVASISYSSLTQSSRDARRRADLEQIRAALEMWRSSEPTALGQYPVYSGDCANLNDGSVTNFPEYLPQIPADPKTTSGFIYLCDSNSTTYSLYSVLESADLDCGASCGGNQCEYAVGPYGKTCGP